MLDWRGKGVSVMEMNHQSLDFLEISDQAEDNLKKLLNIPPDDFTVFFYSGDQGLQLTTICYNLFG